MLLINRIIHPFVYHTAARQMMSKSHPSVAGHYRRANILAEYEDKLPNVGQYLEAELSRDRGQLDGLNHVMNSARGLWELEKHKGQTHSLFDDFCVWVAMSVPKTRLPARSKLAPENLETLKHAQTRFINHIEAVRNHQQTLQPSERMLSQATSDRHSFGATNGNVNSAILATTPNNETQFELKPLTRSDTGGFFERAMRELNGGCDGQQFDCDAGLSECSPDQHNVSFTADHSPQDQYPQPPDWLGNDVQD
jgi:hypothetical protein